MFNKTLVIFICIISSSLVGECNTTDSIIDAFTSKNSIDSSMIYSAKYQGAPPISILTIRINEDNTIDTLEQEKDQSVDDSHFLFWIKNGQSYVKQFIGSSSFKPIVLDSIFPLTFYLKNESKINIEKEKPDTIIVKNESGSYDKYIMECAAASCPDTDISLSFNVRKNPIFISLKKSSLSCTPLTEELVNQIDIIVLSVEKKVKNN